MSGFAALALAVAMALPATARSLGISELPQAPVEPSGLQPLPPAPTSGLPQPSQWFTPAPPSVPAAAPQPAPASISLPGPVVIELPEPEALPRPSGIIVVTNDFSGDTQTTVPNTPLFLPPVPEPSTWAMLIAGFAALGARLLRRRRAAAA